MIDGMSLGRSPLYEDMFRSTRSLCEERLAERSILRLLAAQAHQLFADDTFADLFSDIGRASIPPRIVAVVMVLQRIQGLSDREAVDAFTFDARWKYAAGALDFDYPGFVHTVLVDMRARLRTSERPNRIFEVVLAAAKQAGLVGRRRVLDSTALYDAVSTQDTVTLVRNALVGLLREVEAADSALAQDLLRLCRREDDYRSPGKPKCDWDDRAAREELIDALAFDGYRVLVALEGRSLTERVRIAVQLLAVVLGQDLEQKEDGSYKIAVRVAKDRVISTVDPETRHGHKTESRRFDGYKGHIAEDPDSEMITATEVTAGNGGDAVPAPALIADLVQEASKAEAEGVAAEARPECYGDSSYGTADFLDQLESAHIEPNVHVQPPVAPHGHFSQDRFAIDTEAGTVTCPQGQLVKLRRKSDGSQVAEFGAHCRDCPLRAQCTDSKEGRKVNVHPKHETLRRARNRQKDPKWKERYRATRPKVERKLAHLMRRKHGGRRARVRGRVRVAQDFALLAAAVNLARLAALGTHLPKAGAQ